MSERSARADRQSSGEACLFFARHSALPTAEPPPAGGRIVVWRPGALRWHPPGPFKVRFLFWWLFHQTRLFANRDYAIVLVYDRDRVAHRSCVFPGYFRFPFMAAADVQVGDTWTAPDVRGRSLATTGLRAAVDLLRAPGRTFWYVTRASNVASVRVAEKAGFVLRGHGARVRRFGLRLFGAFIITDPGTEPSAR